MQQAGVSTAQNFKSSAFVITAFFTGMTGGGGGGGGGVGGPSLLDFSTLVFILAMVIVGGLKSTWGPVLGGVFMMVLLEVAKSYGEVRNTLIGILFVCFVLLIANGVT
jgi:branched-chain amino acid transport system permease protein